MAGVGGASSSAGSNSNSSGSAGKNDSNKNDKSSKSSGSDKSESKSSKGSGSERGSFDRAMSDAQNKTDGGNDKNKTEAEQKAEKAAPSKSAPASAHANEFSGLESLNSHRGYGPDEQPAPNPNQKTKTETKTIDVQGKLDKLDRQLAQQKAHEERSLMSSLVPDSGPNASTPEHPTGQKHTPPASSVVYSADPKPTRPALSTQQNPAEATPQANQDTFVDDNMGLLGTTAQVPLNMAEKFIDHESRRATRNTLTLGPDAPLSKSDKFAKDLVDTRTTASEMLEATPFGPDEKSTQQLAKGVKATTPINLASKALAAAQPAAAALQSILETPKDAGPIETALNAVGAAVKEGDDAGLSFVAGSAASAGVVLASPLAGPAAPVVVTVGAPAAGFAAGVGMSEFYNDSVADKFIDKSVDVVVDLLEPAAEKADEAIEFAGEKINDATEYVAENIEAWEEHITKEALYNARRRR